MKTFSVYARVWAVTEGLSLWHDPFLVPHPNYERLLWLFLFLAIVRPSRATLLGGMLVRIAMYCAQAPAIWESNYWVNVVDGVFLCCSLILPLDAVVPACADTIRTHMGLFYIGAGFWKLNTAFLDARVSCASIYVASILSFAPSVVTPSWIVRPALAIAPAMTVLGELTLGMCLLLRSKPANRLGVALAALLHYAIAITPFPNQVSTFGVVCFARFFFVFPAAWTRALTQSGEWALRLPITFGELVQRVAVVTLVGGSAAFTSVPGFQCDWCIVAQTAICLVGAYAIRIDAATTVTPSRGPGGDGTKLSASKRAMIRTIHAASLLLTVSYVFAFLPLGLMDISAVSPFSQIRAHGGSNHLVMPTSLLQQRHRSVGREAAATSLFAGGVVRVTYSTSAYLNALYPANCTDELPERVRAMLTGAGHIAQQFNPTVRVMLGPQMRRELPRWTARSGTRFPAFTVPAYELRRVLALAREEAESFQLEYERLPGTVGSEAWRHHAVESRVRLTQHSDGSARCKVKAVGSAFWHACAADEVAMLPAPSGALAKVMAFFPYPIIPGLDVLPCMD